MIFWFKSLHDSKNFPGFFSQINSWLKKIWNIDLNHVMIQWFESTVDFVDLFSAFTQCRFPFLGFSLNFVHLFGLSLNFADFLGIQQSALTRISSWLMQYHEDVSRFNSWLNWISRNLFRINSWLKCISQVLIHIEPWHKALPHFSIERRANSS